MAASCPRPRPGFSLPASRSACATTFQSQCPSLDLYPDYSQATQSFLTTATHCKASWQPVDIQRAHNLRSFHQHGPKKNLITGCLDSLLRLLYLAACTLTGGAPGCVPAGFAFVYMKDDRDADDAIRALDRYNIMSHELTVFHAVSS